MKGYVSYNNRVVPREGFRVFIYSYEGAQKLVESWEEYEKNILSGSWFSTKASVPSKKPYEKGRK